MKYINVARILKVVLLHIILYNGVLVICSNRLLNLENKTPGKYWFPFKIS